MRLIEALRLSTATAVDMDNAAQRITLDVIGQVGFEKDFGATVSLSGGDADRAFNLMYAGKPCAHVCCLHAVTPIATMPI